MAKTTGRELFASAARVRLVAGQTLHGLLAMRLTLLIGGVGAGLVGLTLWLRTFNFGAGELKFIGDFGLGVVGFFGTVLAALAMAQAFFNALADGTAPGVLTQPVRRADYLAGQFVGVATLLALFTAALGVLVAGLLAWRAMQLGAVVPPLAVLLAACALQWLKLCLVAATTLLLCTYASAALFAGCLGLLLALLGHWRWEFAPGSWLAWLTFWPDLARFDGEAVLAAGVAPSGWVLLGLGGYWVGWLGLLGGLAVYVFQHREL